MLCNLTPIVCRISRAQNNIIEEIAGSEQNRLKEEGDATDIANQYKTEIAAMSSKAQLETFLSRILAANSAGVGINAARPCREACAKIKELDFNCLETGTWPILHNCEVSVSTGDYLRGDS